MTVGELVSELSKYSADAAVLRFDYCLDGVYCELCIDQVIQWEDGTVVIGESSDELRPCRKAECDGKAE